MSKLYTGRVTEVSANPFKNRDGNEIILHSFRIDSTNMWFRTNEVDPKLSVGDAIKFTANRQSVDPASIEQVSLSDLPQPEENPFPSEAKASAPAPKGKAFWAGKDDYWARKEAYDRGVTQPLIALQSARRDAVEIVTAALEHDCLSFGNMKKTDKLDYLVELTIKVQSDLLTHYEEVKKALEENCDAV